MSVRTVPHVRSMAAFALANLGGHDRPSLAQNESAFPPSPAAIEAGRAAVARSHLYPDPDWTLLRHAVARNYRVDAANIVCGAGSMDLIAATLAAFAGPGDAVLTTAYAYSFVASATARVGASLVLAPEQDLTVSVDALLAGVTSATRIVFVCNPGNPTGTRIASSELLRLRAALPGDVLLVVDQAYGEFDEQDPKPVFDLVERGDTIVLRSLSKAYGLAGARVGWGLMAPALSGELRKLLNSNQVTTVSLAMAVAAVEDQDFMRGTVAQTVEIRTRFADALREAGYAVAPSHTNFVLARFAGAVEAEAADAALRQAGIIVRSVAGYGLADCLRITIGMPETMDETVRVLVALRDAAISGETASRR